MPTADSTPFAALTLSSIAYTDETMDGSQKQKNDIIAALSNVGAGAQGPWRLLWGPGTNSGNLVYVALNAARNRFAVAIRGTVSESSWAMLYDLIEDANPLSQVPWQFPLGDGSTKISSGFDGGLQNILAMTDPATDWSLLDFLRKVMTNTSSELVVTGHSLGGALATLVGLWLQDQLPKGGGPSGVNLRPITFAAPTAGNQAFATQYDSRLLNSLRYVNSWDLAPMAYYNLAQLITYYPSPGPSLWDYSESTWVLLDLLAVPLSKIYAPTNQKTGSITFPGPTPKPSHTFPDEVEVQHSIATYTAPLAVPEAEAATGS